MATEPFRITPVLGPDVWMVSTGYYWDMVAPITDPTDPDASYQLRSVVVDNDGNHRMHVRAGSSDIPTDTQVTVSADGIATAGSGGWWTQAAIPANSYFHASDVDPSP